MRWVENPRVDGSIPSQATKHLEAHPRGGLRRFWRCRTRSLDRGTGYDNAGTLVVDDPRGYLLRIYAHLSTKALQEAANVASMIVKTPEAKRA